MAGLKLAVTQSGGDLDSIAASINKLSVNMGKDAEKFAALGVSAKDPLQAFKQLSNIFVAIQDPQQRAAVMAEALGRSWAGAAPLLAEGSKKIGEMVERGTSLSGMTKEAADQADKFKDQMAELNTTMEATKIRIAVDLLPGMNDIAEAMREAAKEGGLLKTVWVGMGGVAANILSPTLTDINEQLEIARKIANMNVGGEKGAAEIRATIDALEKEKARLTPAEKAASPSVDLAAAANAAKKATDFLNAEKLAAERLTAEKKLAQEIKKQKEEELDFLDEYGKLKLAQLTKSREEELDFLDEYGKLLLEQKTKTRENEERLREAADQTETDRFLAEFEALSEIENETKKASDSARDLGFTFSSAFEDAIISGQRLSEVLKGLYKDILRIIARKTVTEPLGNAVTSLLGTALGSLSFGGRGSTSPGMSEASIASVFGPRAEGGSVYAGGSYLVGERGPELFMPQSPGSIVPNSAIGGPSVVINQTVNIDSRTDMASIRVAMIEAKQLAQKEIYDNLRRGGAFSKAVGRA